MVVSRLPAEKTSFLRKPSIASLRKKIKPMMDNSTLAGFAKASGTNFPPSVAGSPMMQQLYVAARATLLQGGQADLAASDLKELESLARAELARSDAGELGLVDSAPNFTTSDQADKTAFLGPIFLVVLFLILVAGVAEFGEGFLGMCILAVAAFIPLASSKLESRNRLRI
jgi:hypothetical protein